MDDVLVKVQEILGDPQKLEGFKNLASSLLNGNQEDDNAQPNINKNKNAMPDIENILKEFVNSNSNGNSNQSKSNEVNDNLNIPLNMDMLLKVQNAISIMNTNDKNIEFLRSLKMLLGDDKKQKVDSAIKIIRLAKLMPLIKDLNLLKDFKII